MCIHFFFVRRFAQDFIDVREKERKRGIRGLVSVPPKHKLDDNFNILNSTFNSTTATANSSVSDSNKSGNSENSPNFKSEDLIELQEKITKEILNSKLQEKEMLELQVWNRIFSIYILVKFLRVNFVGENQP